METRSMKRAKQNEKQGDKKKQANEGISRTSVDVSKCSVCLDTVEGTKMKSLPCAHVFHEICIDKWLMNSNECPICRWPVFESNDASSIMHSTESRLLEESPGSNDEESLGSSYEWPILSDVELIGSSDENSVESNDEESVGSNDEESRGSSYEWPLLSDDESKEPRDEELVGSNDEESRGSSYEWPILSDEESIEPRNEESVGSNDEEQFGMHDEHIPGLNDEGSLELHGEHLLGSSDEESYGGDSEGSSCEIPIVLSDEESNGFSGEDSRELNKSSGEETRGFSDEETNGFIYDESNSQESFECCDELNSDYSYGSDESYDDNSD